ncbi:MAG TPA: ATP-binding protein [Steroidobacteraceae bacterium]
MRRQLLAWLATVFAAVALTAALVTYISFGRTVHWFMDEQLRALVEAQAEAGIAPEPLDEYRVKQKGAIAIQVWQGDELVASSLPTLGVHRQSASGFHDVEADGERWRVYASISGNRTLQGSQSLQFRQRVIRSQALGSALPILLLIPVTALLVWLVVRYVMRKLEIVSRAAAERDAHNLEPLPDAQAPEEIRPLVQAVNRLLVRVKSAFDTQRRFVQDAAHELRTPLAALSLQLENVQVRIADAELKQQVDVLETGVARMKRLAEQLLRLARQDAPIDDRAKTRLDVCAILREVIAELLPLAERRRIDIGLQASVAPIASGNADDIRSVLQNLIDNALRYSPEDSSLEILVTEAAEMIEIRIVDEGPGIAEDHLPRVFDRFFRVEGTNVEGAGLGLAIAQRAAERNGATLSLQNRTDRRGLVASVQLPRHPEHGDFPRSPATHSVQARPKLEDASA